MGWMDEWMIVLEQMVSFTFREKKMCSNYFSIDSCHGQRAYQDLGHCLEGYVFLPTLTQGPLFTSTPHNRKTHSKKSPDHRIVCVTMLNPPFTL